MSKIRYCLDKVRDGFHKGWLNVKFVNGETTVIPLGIEVEVLNSKTPRPLLRLMEGIYQNKLVELLENEDLKLFSSKPLKNIPKLLLDRKTNTLFINNEKTTIIVDKTFNPGEYLLSIPDFPHKTSNTDKYSFEKKGGSRYASTWYKLTRQGEDPTISRVYFHFGTYSEGCITFPYISRPGVSKWSKYVSLLAESRLKRGINAAMLIT